MNTMDFRTFGEKGFPRFPWRWYVAGYGENMPVCWIEAAG